MSSINAASECVCVFVFEAAGRTKKEKLAVTADNLKLHLVCTTQQKK